MFLAKSETQKRKIENVLNKGFVENIMGKLKFI